MSRESLAAWSLAWVGSTLVLSRLRWFRTPALVERLRPYSAGGLSGRSDSGFLSATSIRDVVAPMLATLGDRVARTLGVNDDIEVRLRRAGSHLDPNGFRLKQGALGLGSMFVVTAIFWILKIPIALAALGLVVAPVVCFLALEQRVVNAAELWQARITLELPVVIEQLGMLLSSGYSLGSAISRLGARGRGLTAAELAGVNARMRQGLSEMEALRELATYAGVPALDRLVGVLGLNWEAGDLGALISAEARSVRREVHRGQLELIEKRGQQVWIPVTVATLLPGVIFMAVPFIDAMGKLTGG